MFANLVRLFAAAAAVTAGFTWTVGQSGLRQTNSNLCELWNSLLLPAYPGCEFQYVLAIAWTIVFSLAVVWACIELFRLVRRLTARRNRVLAYSALSVFFVVGSIVSLAFLVAEYRRPAPTAATTEVKPEPPIERAPQLSLFIKVSSGMAPAIFPPDGRINAVPGMGIGPALYTRESGGGGIAEYFGPPGQATSFAKNVIWHKAEVMNDNSAPIMNVKLIFQLTIIDVIRDDPDKGGGSRSGSVLAVKNWPVLIQRIEPGATNAFVIYFHHIGPQFIQVGMPTSGFATKVGDSAEQSVRVLFTPRDITLMPYEGEKSVEKPK